MTRLLTAFSAILLVSGPALAGNYVAKPAAAPVEPSITGKDIRWTYAGGDCRGATELSRPLVLCQDLAKRAGRIVDFVADGRALSADELAKCNRGAKGDRTAASVN